MDGLHNSKRLLLVTVALFLFYFQASAQTVVSGKVMDAVDDSPLVGVSIQVKGKVIGTSSGNDGSFSLSIHSDPPMTIIVSSIGFETQEIPITRQNEYLSISLNQKTIMGDEVVVSASRVPVNLLLSPVSIELLNTRTIQSSPQPSFYDALINIKGVEMTTQSLTFRSVNTRGFGANGNTRVVQLMDGMDNQAPGLNFAVGNVVGMSELDVESVELLPGAASALYGPNAINGLLLMNSKSPFDYQGVSAYAKSGVMSASNRTKTNTAFYDVAFRFAKSYNNRLAFKVNAAYLTADDWQATDYRDQSFLNGTNLENNVHNRQNSPYYDGVNWYGDVGANVYDILRANGIPGAGGADGSSAALGAILTTKIPDAGNATLPQLLGGTTQEEQIGIANSIFNTITPQYYFNAPGFSEQELTNYDAKSLKLNASLHYRITDDVEAILQANWGKGSSVYTAADRYNIQKFTMGQYKAELRGDNFFVRGYTTRENSGDAHALGVLGGLMSSRWLGTAIGEGAPKFVESSFSQYATKLLTDYQINLAGGMNQQEAMGAAYLSANAFAESNREDWMAAALAPGAATANGMYNVGGTNFESAKADIKSKPIPIGAHFLDRSNLYHAEGMYDFKRLINPETIELLAGANYRIYDLNSEGTLFATTPSGKEFNIKEYGAYIQGAKTFADVFKLTASVRYDKNENFEGQFSPRISGVYTFIPNHNLRASFQRGFRIPTTQNQYIDLLTPQARLIGGLPLFREKYDMINNPVYRLTETGPQPFEFKKWQPERVETYEVGYKSLIAEKLFVDMFYYYNRFLTFEGSAVLVQKKDANGPMTDLADPTKRNVYSMPLNAEQTVKNSGWGIGLDYMIGGGYVVNGNITQNELLNKKELKEKDPSFVTSFNSPKYRFNIGISNRNINRSGYGFGVTFRHQTEMLWNASIATVVANANGSTIIPAYSTVDAQISKSLPAFKSVVKLGATNIGNKLYTTGWGNPSIGGMYYLSIVFDEVFN